MVQHAAVAIDVTDAERRDFYCPLSAPGGRDCRHAADKVLPIRHHRVSDQDKVVWAIPSGGIDEGEEPRAAQFLRELREETGYQAKQAEEIIRYKSSYGSSDQLFITGLPAILDVGMG